MNLSSNPKQTSGGSTDLIFDIRSGSVGVCFVSTGGDTPKIHWSKRISVDFLSEHDTDRLLHMTKEALKKAVAAAKKEGLAALEETTDEDNYTLGGVYCYFAAPWQIGSPQEITIQHESPFDVNEKRLQLVRKKARDMFSENALDQFDAEKESLVPLTTALLGYWCNGYRLKKPRGVSTKKLRVSTYISMLPQRVRTAVEDVVSNEFHPTQISHHSFTSAIQRAFTKRFSHPKTFLVVNVDEEMTQLLVINSGVFMGSVSYPVGSHFLIRQVAKSLDVPAADARAQLRQYQEGEAENKRQEEVEKVIDKTRDKWQDLLVNSLGEFSADVSIPEYAFVLANHDASKSFSEFTKDVSVENHLLRENSFRVHEVTDDLLQIHVATQEDHSDHYLSIASVIHTDTQTDVVGS